MRLKAMEASNPDHRPTILDRLKDAAVSTPVKRYINQCIRSLALDLGSSRAFPNSDPMPREFADSADIPAFEEFEGRLVAMAELGTDSPRPRRAVIELLVEGRPLDLHVTWNGTGPGYSINLRLDLPAPIPRTPADPVYPRIVYSPHYDIGLFGLERLHPFDTRKYSRAYEVLERQLGPRLWRATSFPFQPVSREELLAVHARSYLDQLKDSAYVARALEMPPVRWLPRWLIDRCVLRPMRWATAGTLVAAKEAVLTGLSVNMCGGYHHASRDRGEGFCIYSDIALAVHELRRTNRLSAQDKIIYVDLDAHQGNGVCHEFFDDRAVMIFDMYNQHIYPASDAKAKRRIDCAVPLADGCHEADYLVALRSKLPPFLDAVARAGRVGLAIYNAGTDIYRGDSLGGMNVSAEGVLDRDRLVIEELLGRAMPTLMLLSGGYSRDSYHLVANSISYILNTWPR